MQFLIKFDTIKIFIYLIMINSSHVSGYLDNQNSSYDFIIIGGGTAGCVLANRLSANGRYTVLVLEAGGIPPESVKVPAFASEILKNPNITFQYNTVPHKRFGLAKGGVFKIVLGKVLGGTSEINTMVFNRGSPFDFDSWARLTGDRSWEYSELLKYFKKSEDYLGEFPSRSQHGFGGLISVSSQNYAPGREFWFEAWKELGFRFGDPNGPQRVGVSPVEFSRRFGRRVGAYEGYLEQIMNSRGNLRVVTDALVTQIVS